MSAEVVDTAALRADDALLDALGGRTTTAGGVAHDELSVLLTDWRRDLDTRTGGTR